MSHLAGLEERRSLRHPSFDYNIEIIKFYYSEMNIIKIYYTKCFIIQYNIYSGIHINAFVIDH